jgi:hypothetical protein
MGVGMKDHITGQLLALEQQMAEIKQRLAQMQTTRNDAIEEVAVAIERMECFGPDTINSFAIYIREMKQ